MALNGAPNGALNGALSLPVAYDYRNCRVAAFRPVGNVITSRDGSILSSRLVSSADEWSGLYWSCDVVAARNTSVTTA
jgi:hypothetical protein